MRLNELGERKVIRQILNQNRPWKPDDCYAMENGEEYILISSDIISKESHIPTMQYPELIGRFAANVNLSDIAAMAAIPEGMTVSYVVDGNTEDSFLEAVHRGITEELKKNDADIFGGDTKEGHGFVIGGTILGKQKKELTRFRSHIKPRQIVGHTNTLGRAASGYIFHKSGYSKEEGIRMLLGIQARVHEASILSKAGARFMMDMSDGLYSCMSQMKEDYGIGFKIVHDEINIDRHADKASLISGLSPLEIATNFGGDYELLFTVDSDNYEQLSESAKSEGIDVSFIGETWEGDNLLYDGQQWIKVSGKGWEHFSKNPLTFRV